MPPIRRCTALLLYALRDAHLIFLECDFPDTLCRVEDFWVGYKLFCYAFYSNSVQHEGEFQQSKLGLWFFPSSMFQCTLSFIPPQSAMPFGFCNFSQCISNLHVWTGQLVWRRHPHPPPPSRRMLRTTCTQMLPLVEMYCRWELQEDCGNLHELMLRFDSEVELQTHALGRSLLAMLRDEDNNLEGLPRRAVLDTTPNPFDAVRDRLAAVDSAIRNLHAQVQRLDLIPCKTRLPHSWVI